jgi:hypothetical protein
LEEFGTLWKDSLDANKKRKKKRRKEKRMKEKEIRPDFSRGADLISCGRQEFRFVSCVG